MAKKPLVDPNLVEYRDGLNRTVEARLADQTSDTVLGLADVIKALTRLTETYGGNLDGLVIPDGFLDGLGQNARRLALAGVLLALKEVVS